MILKRLSLFLLLFLFVLDLILTCFFHIYQQKQIWKAKRAQHKERKKAAASRSRKAFDARLRNARDRPKEFQRRLEALIEPLIIDEWTMQHRTRHSQNIHTIKKSQLEMKLDQVARRMMAYRLHLVESQVFRKLFVQNQLLVGNMARFKFPKRVVPHLFSMADPFGNCFKKDPPFLVLISAIVKNEEDLMNVQHKRKGIEVRMILLEETGREGNVEYLRLKDEIFPYNEREGVLLLECAVFMRTLSEDFNM